MYSLVVSCDWDSGEKKTAMCSKIEELWRTHKIFFENNNYVMIEKNTILYVLTVLLKLHCFRLCLKKCEFNKEI